MRMAFCFTDRLTPQPPPPVFLEAEALAGLSAPRLKATCQNLGYNKEGNQMSKKRRCITLLSAALLFSTASFVAAAEQPDAQQLFKKKCALCHAIDSKTLGPAVNTMSNEKEVLRQAIAKGKGSMPGYDGKLTGAQIDALVDYLLANQ